ncbi:hypothetical protein AB0M45_24400 [Nocardia sp. NPDC051787]|uniref:hypothetical protein n=1 Tax=Nocardia sp. NPDC051787 TaxID=3155415 RepID=UPI0034241B33
MVFEHLERTSIRQLPPQSRRIDIVAGHTGFRLAVVPGAELTAGPSGPGWLLAVCLPLRGQVVS